MARSLGPALDFGALTGPRSSNVLDGAMQQSLEPQPVFDPFQFTPFNVFENMFMEQQLQEMEREREEIDRNLQFNTFINEEPIQSLPNLANPNPVTLGQRSERARAEIEARNAIARNFDLEAINPQQQNQRTNELDNLSARLGTARLGVPLPTENPMRSTPTPEINPNREARSQAQWGFAPIPAMNPTTQHGLNTATQNPVALDAERDALAENSNPNTVNSLATPFGVFSAPAPVPEPNPHRGELDAFSAVEASQPNMGHALAGQPATPSFSAPNMGHALAGTPAAPNLSGFGHALSGLSPVATAAQNPSQVAAFAAPALASAAQPNMGHALAGTPAAATPAPMSGLGAALSGTPAAPAAPDDSNITSIDLGEALGIDPNAGIIGEHSANVAAAAIGARDAATTAAINSAEDQAMISSLEAGQPNFGALSNALSANAFSAPEPATPAPVSGIDPFGGIGPIGAGGEFGGATAGAGAIGGGATVGDPGLDAEAGGFGFGDMGLGESDFGDADAFGDDGIGSDVGFGGSDFGDSDTSDADSGGSVGGTSGGIGSDTSDADSGGSIGGTSGDFGDSDAFGDDGIGSDTGDSGDGDGEGDCVIATHAVSAGAFSRRDRARAVRWCRANLHDHWAGETVRRGYQHLGKGQIERGQANRYYGEFQRYIDTATGKRKGLTDRLHFAARTVQFFIVGMFV